MSGLLRDFAGDRAGATSIEYALIATFIALAIFSSLVVLGTNLSVPYVKVSDGLK
jgi:Flp pilus assembly pilin Flp